MPKPFLTCEWRDLFLATYAVPPSLLTPRLPPGLELETRGGDAFVSLVAFDFLRIAPQFPLVRGIYPVTRLGNCAELNLRFYVRRGGDRGVVFVREFVPRRLLAWPARLLYNEPYLVAPLTSRCQDSPGARGMEYRLRRGGREHVLAVTGRKPTYLPREGTDEHFFTELYWGFGRTRRGRTLRYEVSHPAWEVFPVESYRVDLDWGRVYGPEWEALTKATPVSAVFAAGSPIAVYPHGPLA